MSVLCNSNCHQQDCALKCCDYWGKCPQKVQKCHYNYQLYKSIDQCINPPSQKISYTAAIIGGVLVALFIIGVGIFLYFWCKKKTGGAKYTQPPIPQYKGMASQQKSTLSQSQSAKTLANDTEQINSEQLFEEISQKQKQKTNKNKLNQQIITQSLSDAQNSMKDNDIISRQQISKQIQQKIKSKTVKQSIKISLNSK